MSYIFISDPQNETNCHVSKTYTERWEGKGTREIRYVIFMYKLLTIYVIIMCCKHVLIDKYAYN